MKGNDVSMKVHFLRKKEGEEKKQMVIGNGNVFSIASRILD